MEIKNFSINKRLWIIGGLSFFILILIEIFNLFSIAKIEKRMNNFSDNQLLSVKFQTVVNMFNAELRTEVFRATIAATNGNKAELEMVSAKYDNLTKNMRKQFADIDEVTSLSIETKEHNKKIAKEIDKQISSGLEIVRLAEKRNVQEALVKLESYNKSFDTANKELKTLQEYLETDINKLNMENEFGINILKRVKLIIETICILIIIFFFLKVSKSISLQLNDVSIVLKEGANEVGIAVIEMSNASSNLSDSANQQAAALEQTSSAVNEISSMLSKSAELSKTAENTSSSSKEKAEIGGHIITEMREAMKLITENTELLASQMQEGNEKFQSIINVIQEVGQKTKVINEIVFQTKLLSFNASVEAARAGEHGKGFSIVAEEVGNLAQMSGAAAKEINNLLEQSLKKVHTVVEDVKNKIDESLTSARKSVTTGSKTVENCRNVLEEIQAYSAQLNNMVTSISTASLESSLVVEEISKALMKLNSATQINAKAANCCSDAYSILSEQVHKLRTSATSLRQVIGGNLILDKFIWKDAYALDIPSMDGEHKILINKINNLADAFAQKSDLKSAFQDLAEYTQKHFAHEEDYMRSISYPSLNSHQKLHTNLLAQVKKFGEQINSETINPDELMNFLNDWLLRHILGTDMKYAKYVKEGNNDFKNTF